MLESLFNKVASLRVCNLIKKRLQQRCSPVKFARFLRRPPVAVSKMFNFLGKFAMK